MQPNINTNNDSDEEEVYFQGENPSYQEIRKYQTNNFPSGYEKSREISSKMQYNAPQGKGSKISSKSENYYTFYTQTSSPKVNFESKNTAKKYMDKRAFTPSRIGNHFNDNDNKYFNGYYSELREEYSHPMMNNGVNIRKKIYKENQTPQHYITNNEENEEFLENYGYHETKDIKDKGHKKFDSITHITGYSNLIPLNRLKQCGRIETYNYSSKKEEERKPNFKNAIEKVRELQRGKREYDEFMRKLGAQDPEEERIEKFEKYKKEQIRQQEIREEKIRMERLEKDRLREQQIKNEKLRQEKMRQEQIRMERMRHEEELRKEKMRNDLSRKEELKLITIREEKIRQEKIRQEKIREERIRQEKIKQEKIRQEKIKQDKITQEKLSQERLKQQQKPKKSVQKKVETYKKITVNTEVNNPRSDSVKKQFKAHSGKYTYKDNIMEEINHYRSNSNYNKEFNNVSKKETVYKNKKNKESSKSSSKLPIKIDIKANTNKSTSYSRNYSSQNFKSISKQESNKNMNISYQIKTTKTQTNINKDKNIKNYRIAPKKITTNTSNYSKKSYTSNTSYTNKSKTKSIPVQNNNYKRSVLKIAEKTTSLNYPNPGIKVDTYSPNYTGEQYHRDYINIESVKNGKIANHIHTGISKDGQYLINMTSSQKILDSNEYNKKYEPPEKNVEEIVSTIRERKKNLGDNYAFYERKDLQKPDNTSYTIHKRFGERTIYGKEKYETRKVRHYKLKPEDEKYLSMNEGYDNREYDVYNERYDDYNDNRNINYEDDYQNINYDYSPDYPEGEEVNEEYEKRIEEYNYEN